MVRDGRFLQQTRSERMRINKAIAATSGSNSDGTKNKPNSSNVAQNRQGSLQFQHEFTRSGKGISVAHLSDNQDGDSD